MIAFYFISLFLFVYIDQHGPYLNIFDVVPCSSQVPCSLPLGPGLTDEYILPYIAPFVKAILELLIRKMISLSKILD